MLKYINLSNPWK